MALWEQGEDCYGVLSPSAQWQFPPWEERDRVSSSLMGALSPPRSRSGQGFLNPACSTSQKLAEKVLSGSNLNWPFLPGALL